MNRRDLLTLGIVGLALAAALVAAGSYLYQKEANFVAYYNATKEAVADDFPVEEQDLPLEVPPWAWACFGGAVVFGAGGAFCLYRGIRTRPAPVVAPEPTEAPPDGAKLWKRREPAPRS
jgi:drug/metabolite transporter (DMT)-like permease